MTAAIHPCGYRENFEFERHDSRLDDVVHHWQDVQVTLYKLHTLPVPHEVSSCSATQLPFVLYTTQLHHVVPNHVGIPLLYGASDRVTASVWNVLTDNSKQYWLGIAAAQLWLLIFLCTVLYKYSAVLVSYLEWTGLEELCDSAVKQQTDKEWLWCGQVLSCNEKGCWRFWRTFTLSQLSLAAHF